METKDYSLLGVEKILGHNYISFSYLSGTEITIKVYKKGQLITVYTPHHLLLEKKTGQKLGYSKVLNELMIKRYIWIRLRNTKKYGITLEGIVFDDRDYYITEEYTNLSFIEWLKSLGNYKFDMKTKINQPMY